MRYLCVHCDKRFAHEGDKKPRCPECMRVNGLEKLDDAAGSTVPTWVKPAVLAGLVAAVIGGYLFWARETPDSVGAEVALEPLDQSALEGHVRRLRADVPEELIGLLDADETVGQLGAETEGGASGMADAIRRRASKRGFIAWGMSQPRETPLMGTAAVLDAMSADGAEAILYPLEVAALAVAALRSEGVDAMVAEMWSFEGDRIPPDPSGHFGYYGVAVYPDAVGEGTPSLSDPYGGHGDPEEDAFRVLNDVEVLGAAVNHLAMHALVRDGDHSAAYALSETALLLDPRSPSARSVRGAVLLMSDRADEGISEFEAAAQLRGDSPRRNNLAGLYLATQPPDLDRASREASAALEQHSEFAGAHAILGAIHMANGDNGMASEKLEMAQRLDPELPMLPMLWATYYLRTHQVELAADKAQLAIERQPHNWQARLSAASVLRQAGRYDAMREQARQIVEMVADGRRSDVERLVLQVLGPTALEEAIEDDLSFAEDLDAPGGDFQLGGDSALLGGSEEAGGLGGSLLDEDLGGGDLSNLGDPSRLRLGGSGGGGLRLNLNE